MVISAKDIPDEKALDAIRSTKGKWGVPDWSMTGDIQANLNQYPPKVVLAKLKSLVKRQVIGGCACGCKGNFYIR